jgi:hypothetical protein
LVVWGDIVPIEILGGHCQLGNSLRGVCEIFLLYIYIYLIFFIIGKMCRNIIGADMAL